MGGAPADLVRSRSLFDDLLPLLIIGGIAAVTLGGVGIASGFNIKDRLNNLTQQTNFEPKTYAENPTSQNIVYSLSDQARRLLNFGGTPQTSTEQEGRYIPGPVRLTREQLLNWGS